MAEMYGNDPELAYKHMAEKIFGSDVESTPKPRRGPKEDIEDEDLWRTRDHLVWLLETTWADVRGKFSSIKTSADVCAAIQIWQERSHEYVVQTLLRPSSRPATGRSLSKTRRRIGDLNANRMKAWEHREQCRESLEKAQRAFTPQLSEGEKLILEDQRSTRVRKFAHAEAEYKALQGRQADMEQNLQDGEAHFARTEFARFCKSGRYMLKPLNTANAVAGLPFIGWRRSMDRCKTVEASGVNGRAMQVFDAIRRIVHSCARKSELVRHAEQWLRSQGPSKSIGVNELQEKWFYLRWSIKTVLEARTRTRDLPYAIAREYDKRKNHPSNVDLLFEEEERIIVN